MEEQKWYDMADSVHVGLEQYLEKKVLSQDKIYEFVRSACRAVLNRERFYNPYSGQEPELILNSFYSLIQSAMAYESALTMVPLQMSLYKGGQLTLREFIDYLRDSVLIMNGYDIPAAEEDEKEHQKLEDDFNEWLDKAEDAAEEEEYKKAIEALDAAFALAEKEPLLFYDRCTVYNNRAYYNFRLGNFEEALKDCETAIEDHAQGLFYHTKAEILLGMKKYEDALAAIEKAIELAPGREKSDFKKEIEKLMK